MAGVGSGVETLIFPFGYVARIFCGGAGPKSPAPASKKTRAFPNEKLNVSQMPFFVFGVARW